MGLTTESESQEFEALCAQYPEIETARNAFERTLEERLLQDAPSPPLFLKEQLIKELETGIKTSSDHTDSGYSEEPPVRQINPWKWLAAASFILLAASIFWAVSINNKYQDLKTVAANNQSLQAQLEETKAQLSSLKEDASTIQKPGMKLASLKGLPSTPTAQVTVAWDTTSKDVYLILNNLPKPASDQQYQLWALINSKPVDLGVFDLKQEKLLVKMKNVQNAQAFAITLERRGGSPTPTMDKMYVYGKL